MWELVWEITKWAMSITSVVLFVGAVIIVVRTHLIYTDEYWDKYIDEQVKAGKGPFESIPKELR